MPKRKTDDEFRSEVFDLVGNEYEFLDKYRGSDTKIKVKHKVCNYEYFVTPSKFLNRCQRCPLCNGGIKITEEIFVNYLLKKIGEDYKLVSSYTGYTNKLKIIHNKCGYEWEVNGNYFINNQKECPNCKIKKQKEEKTEVFKIKVFELVRGEYEVIGLYESYNDPLEIKHMECENTYLVRPSHFIGRNHRCPFCSKNRRKTTESFKDEVYNKYGEEYCVIGEYYNDRTEIEIRHNTCNYVFSVPPREFLDKSQCPVCNNGCQRIDTEIFELKMQKIIGEDYVTVSDYIDSRTRIKLKHITCDQTFDALPNHVISRQTTRCPNCFGGKRISHDEFLDIVEETHGGEYKILGTYKNSDTPIEVKHMKCNHVFFPIPYGFMRGTGCPKCAGVLNLTHDEFLERLLKIGMTEEYVILEEYKNMSTKLLTKHISCGYTYYANPSVLLRGSGCIKCKESKGEKTITEYLTINSIRFESQYRFDDCRNINPLPFDFAAFSNKNKLILLIEYDGEQHYEPIEHFGGEENLKYVQNNDSIKNKYCEANNIPLLRIPYWHFDRIEEILDSELNKYI